MDKPIIVPNTGILDTTKQATIEFWTSPSWIPPTIQKLELILMRMALP